jgi:opacity protein-like surface antigen
MTGPYLRIDMQKYICRIILLILILTGVHSFAAAQAAQTPKHSEWEASFFGGFASASDQTSLTPVEGQSSARSVGLDYKNGYLLGMRITQNLGDYLGAELEYSYADQPLDFVNLRPSLPTLDVKHKIHSVIYSILVYPFPRSKRLRPYGTIGGGTSFFYIGKDSKNKAAAEGIVLKDRWKFAFSFGGGVKYLLTQKLGVRVDVRDQITGVPNYGLPDTSPILPGGEIGAAFRADGRVHNWMLNVGLNYCWGGR